ncbi:MAG TPA: hypothetical protein VD905_17730, partial [Flavobacteriales bacterium]|nr:hypothetical protein [Flavobacteriales bacterium]
MKKRMRNVTVNGFFKGLTKVYIGIIVSMIMLSAVFYYVRMINENPLPPPFDKTLALIIAGVVSVFSILVAHLIYATMTRKIQGIGTLAGKMHQFRIANVIRFAMSELPIIISVVFFFLTGYYELFIFAGIGLLHFFTLLPSKQQFISLFNP